MVSISSRLKQLLLMLSSDQPGEIVAAATAIGKILEREGVDWHDLVNGLLKDAPQSKQSADTNHDEDVTDCCDWRQLREYCLARPTRLSDRERNFLNDIGRWHGELTPKQAHWL